MSVIVNVTQPGPIMSLAELKQHLRVDSTDEDLLIQGQLAAAQREVEKYTRHAFTSRTVDVMLDDWPAGDVIKLPVWPVSAITSVKYTDEDAAESTFFSASYVTDLNSLPARIALKSSSSWPSDTLLPVGAIAIRVTCGYSAANEIPAEALQVVKLLVGQWFEGREGLQPTYMKDIPLGLKRMLWGLRVRL